MVTLPSNSSRCVVRVVRSAMQDLAIPITGIASMPLSHAQRTAIAAVDGQGTIHLFFTPLENEVMTWNPSTDAAATAAAAQQPLQTALGSTAGSAPAAAAAAAQERRLEAADSGDVGILTT